MEKEHDSCRAQHGYTTDKQAYLRRLRLIKGQTRGIVRIVGRGKYYIDIMTQISAVTSAFRVVSMALLKDHLGHYVVVVVRENGDAAQGRLNEAMTITSRSTR